MSDASDSKSTLPLTYPPATIDTKSEDVNIKNDVEAGAEGSTQVATKSPSLQLRKSTTLYHYRTKDEIMNLARYQNISTNMYVYNNIHWRDDAREN